MSGPDYPSMFRSIPVRRSQTSGWQNHLADAIPTSQSSQIQKLGLSQFERPTPSGPRAKRLHETGIDVLSIIHFTASSLIHA
jgi:hypothetical protein